MQDRSNWDYFVQDSYFNVGMSSPEVTAVPPPNNINGDHLTPTNSSLLHGQDNRNISAESYQNRQQTHSEDELYLRVQRQSEELLGFLLLKASPTKEQIQSEI